MNVLTCLVNFICAPLSSDSSWPTPEATTPAEVNIVALIVMFPRLTYDIRKPIAKGEELYEWSMSGSSRCQLMCIATKATKIQ